MRALKNLMDSRARGPHGSGMRQDCVVNTILRGINCVISDISAHRAECDQLPLSSQGWRGYMKQGF
jgi:hypothetical protein